MVRFVDENGRYVDDDGYTHVHGPDEPCPEREMVLRPLKRARAPRKADHRLDGINNPLTVCANPLCRRPIGVEFVLQRSTMHVRWFCSVGCVVDGQEEVNRQIWAMTEPPPPGWEPS